MMQTDLKLQRLDLAMMARQAKFVEFGPSTALLLARLLSSAGDAGNAIAVLRAAVVRFPGDPWANYELAKILNETEPPQADESNRFYTAARALKPETGDELAEILEKRGRDDEAVALLRELARIDPEPTRNLLRLSTLLRQRGEFDEARTVADRMVAPYRERAKRQPDNALAYRIIAILLLLSHDLSGAASAYRQAARANPKDAECRRRARFGSE